MKPYILFLTGILAGCGSINDFNATALSKTGQDLAGTVKNKQTADDIAYMAWVASACNINIGALQRNASGNPYAVRAAFMACPVSGLAIMEAPGVSINALPQPVQPTGK